MGIGRNEREGNGLGGLDTHLTVTSDEGKKSFCRLLEDKDWETLKDGNQLTLSYEIEGETVKVWIEIVDDHGISSKTGAKIIDWEINETPLNSVPPKVEFISRIFQE